MKVINHDTKTVLDIVERSNNYNDDVCWQYSIRLNNKQSDLEESGLTEDDVKDLKVSDFTFEYVPKTDTQMAKDIKAFIEKHEWLGKIGIYPTHYFVTKYKGVLAGVVIMDMPNAFSTILGVKTKKIERLISRGACISWSPKNLASSLIMFAINWMVRNTHYRVFTAYSDPEAKELGTIYQACNFYYLGQNSGTTKQYKIENGRWVSDRHFRSRSVYKRLAKENGIELDDNWILKEKIHWELMPNEVALEIKRLSKEYQNSCEVRIVPRKHKYLYILGSNKKETRLLREEFVKLNPKLANLPYPKQRGV
jgi:hypothetical protein